MSFEYKVIKYLVKYYIIIHILNVYTSILGTLLLFYFCNITKNKLKINNALKR